MSEHEDIGVRPEAPSGADEAVEDLGAGRGPGKPSLLDRQKRAAADELRSLAGVMRRSADEFEAQEEAAAAGYVRKAAEAVDRLSSSLKECDTDQLLDRAQDALRHRPGAILGLTAAAGFVIGRALRARPHPDRGRPEAGSGGRAKGG